MLIVAPAQAAAQPFRLGVSYSRPIPTGSSVGIAWVATATDSQNSIYILENGYISADSFAVVAYLVKMASDGSHLIYQTQLTFAASYMAVDPAGNVYLAGASNCSSGGCPGMVEKLGTDGATVLYATTIAPDAALNGLAVDPGGRAYVIGTTNSADLLTTPGALQPTATQANPTQEFVVRLKASGAVDYATYLGGDSQAYSVAVAADLSGSAFIAGFAFTEDFPTTAGAYLTPSGIPNFAGASYLVRLSPDGSSLVYATFVDAQGSPAQGLALDAADNATVALATGANAAGLVRINAQGTAVTLAKIFPASLVEGVVVDGSGNTYLALAARGNFATQDSLSPCGAGGSPALAVVDADGNILQSTYIPGYGTTPTAIGLGASSSVYVVASPADSSSGLLFLTSLSPNANAPVVQLACIGNAASYDSSGISGGEIVSLFGQGLGPATGTQPQVDLAGGFPSQLAGVQVTFNGIPGPLLYVQDAQINAIAPWSLPATGTVSICVVYNGVTTNCIARPAVSEHPGVFTVDGTYAVALNQDGSINSAANPAQIGSTVSIFATGLGPLSPAQPDGAIVGMPLPVNVLADDVYYLDDTMFIGVIAVGAQVSYAGPAPFEVAGFSQVNFVAGDNSGPYGPFPYILQAGGTPSEGAIIEPGSNGFLVHIAGVAEN